MEQNWREKNLAILRQPKVGIGTVLMGVGHHHQRKVKLSPHGSTAIGSGWIRGSERSGGGGLKKSVIAQIEPFQWQNFLYLNSPIARRAHVLFKKAQ